MTDMTMTYDRWCTWAQDQGFKLWNNHPGYTIEKLNKQLKPFGLKLETVEIDSDLWFKVVKIS